jgi:hypothetical protein
MVAGDGSVLEGLSSNFFGVLHGSLRTEGDRALLGVTRSLVVEVAATVLPIEERAVRGRPPHPRRVLHHQRAREVLRWCGSTAATWATGSRARAARSPALAELVGRGEALVGVTTRPSKALTGRQRT